MAVEIKPVDTAKTAARFIFDRKRAGLENIFQKAEAVQVLWEFSEDLAYERKSLFPY